jgi:hypothetical protein
VGTVTIQIKAGSKIHQTFKPLEGLLVNQQIVDAALLGRRRKEDLRAANKN